DSNPKYCLSAAGKSICAHFKHFDPDLEEADRVVLASSSAFWKARAISGDSPMSTLFTTRPVGSVRCVTRVCPSILLATSRASFAGSTTWTHRLNPFAGLRLAGADHTRTVVASLENKARAAPGQLTLNQSDLLKTYVIAIVVSLI